MNDILNVEAGLMAIAEHCVKYIKNLMQHIPKTGRRYRVPGRKRKYTASSPGQPPAVRTGHLKNHITRSDPVRTKDRVIIAIGTNIEYAQYLENGTSRIKKRPAWKRALQDAESQKVIMQKVKEFFGG